MNDITSRQSQIEALDIGESIAIARRIDLTMGCDPDDLSEMNDRIRGIMDQQVNRARRKGVNDFKVETGRFVTRDGSLMLVAVCSRIG